MYQDAVALVAPDNPVALGLAAEVGVNTYATISLPGLTKVHQQPSQSTKEIRVDDSNNMIVFFPGEENHQDYCSIFLSRLLSHV